MFKLYTAIVRSTHALGKQRRNHTCLIVLATTHSEAVMWIERYCGKQMFEMLSIGEGSKGLAAFDPDKHDSTWVFDQNAEMKWFQLP